MREDFTKKTKDIIANRVAWRCSFPGCNRNTIGAGHKSSSHVINLGEAAHICAASSNGPRYDKNMSSNQRTSVDNAIWMCRQHARIIDSDYTNYSAETLKQWKSNAEQKVYMSLQTLERETVEFSTTLISIGDSIIFEGRWQSAIDGIWKFEIVRFISEEINDIKTFNDDNHPDSQKYIVIETQGDGRFFEGSLDWEIIDNKYYIALKPTEKSSRRTPYHLKGISWNLELENGSLKMAQGEEYAKQLIEATLSFEQGDMLFSPGFGSFLSLYYWNYKDDARLLNRMIKLEITRLVSIPYKDSINSVARAPLDFINRVLEVEVLNLETKDSKIQIFVKLEWGDGKSWDGTIVVYLKPKENSNYKNSLNN